MAKGAETREERTARLLEKANSLPLRPGVYIMKNAFGEVIYVGKSRKLKNRVSQYFQNSEKNIKTEKMVAAVQDFDFFLCDTEMEALTLENVLIKEHYPRYNINLKDSKSYPYIKVTTGEEYPRLVVTRTRGADRAKYFGPYSGASVAYNIVDTLCKTLGIPNCKRVFPRDIGKERPCMYYQIGQCMGVCRKGSVKEEYDAAVSAALRVLGGDFALAKDELEKRMYHCAETENFEAAAKCRDSIAALEKISERQKVVSSPKAEQDVVALYSDEKCSVISVFYVRGGMLVDKGEYVFSADEILSDEDIPSFLCGLYSTREYIPREILLYNDTDAESIEALAALLSEKAGRKISVHRPLRGELKKLCEMVRDNAAEKAAKFAQASERDNKMLAKLAALLALPSPPQRIEAYDISNLGKEHITAGMIVAENGKLKKKEYRSFSIRTTDGIDDYGAMRETLSRRLAHLADEEGSFSHRPDLILLDGGAGHVGTVRALLRELGISIPVYGMVKDEHHKTRALTDGERDISIAREQSVFVFIYGLQEEVHRYAVSRMDSAKRKTLKRSVLEDVPGIGPAKAKKYMKAAGSLTALKGADIGKLAEWGIPPKDAAAIVAYFHQKQENDT
ncbi:MAG: excinuclease ABC subunit UvrC [Clostridia bacterium]|nr:excinuclease ABC subunit UvrC [Clostridia bacterium]